ncbi:MAG: hypothetical protein GC160_04065 [Acidobacteria bacterium]|nr:hypothetical protein [Acidobacteriota bacterium]
MSKKMIFIVAGVAVLFLGAGVAAGVYFLGDKAQANSEPVEDTSIGLVEMETFLTNINDPSGKHHARLQLKIAVMPQSAAETIKADPLLMARMRDQVLTLLTAKTFQELSQSEGKEQFRKEITERLAPLIKTGKVSEILFSDFVVQ